jgi:hypothetical protein
LLADACENDVDLRFSGLRVKDRFDVQVVKDPLSLSRPKSVVMRLSMDDAWTARCR